MRIPSARPPHGRSLVEALRHRVRGEVRFDAGSRALYATDASNYRQVPIGVVVPRDTADVVATMAVARDYQVPLLSRGGGTSLGGQCCNAALVVDHSKHLNRVININPSARLASVQGGCVLDDLRSAAGREGLTFGPDPATHGHCTIGGMLGNNSCGIHSLLSAKHGLGLRTSDNTHELDILTAAGDRFRVGPTPPDVFARIIRAGGPQADIYTKLDALRDRYAPAIRERFPKLPRRVSGYNLDDLLPENGFHVARALVGSEGTLVTILDATLHLVPAPAVRSLLVLGYPDLAAAGDQVSEILPLQPTGLEGLDDRLIGYVRRKGERSEALALLPPGDVFLLVEFAGDSQQDADDQVKRCMDRLGRQPKPPGMSHVSDMEQVEQLWRVRESGLGATAFVPGVPDMWPGWEDSAVPPDRVGPYLRDLSGLFAKYGYQPALYGHFGQGCIHCRVDFDLYTAEGIRRWRSFLDESAELVVRYGGSLSGEHGDGQARADLLPRMFDAELMQAFEQFKAIWDPDGRMNPGKIVHAAPITSHLRLGTDYRPPQPATHFQYPEDQGAFSRAVLRCVGVGACRDHGGQVMCPSYMVTRDERHSTRGRARLLWEMLKGDVLTDGWQSEDVREALDLCLACKGCKRDCPVSVDMATHKAEFLSHYYARRWRPRQAFAMGWIQHWARLASLAPTFVNVIGRTPGVRDVVKWIGGIAPNRRLPTFASETFTHWFARRRPRRRGGPQVVLWPDTFSNYFHPEIGRAAVFVLESAGFDVLVPAGPVCCGRPLYDFGMLDLATRRLREVLERLRPALRSGLPVIGLEPSCVSVFRDELGNLLPNDQDAARLRAQTFLFSEFLSTRVPDVRLPTLNRHAIVHGHCHQKALMGMAHDEAILRRMGVTVETPEAGCCGMAGAFGFERGDHYRVSVACGERALLPAVRQAAPDVLIVANGFSCQEQIAQGAGRRARHIAEVMRIGYRLNGTPGRTSRVSDRRSAAVTAAAVGLATLVAWRAACAILTRHTAHDAPTPPRRSRCVGRSCTPWMVSARSRWCSRPATR